MKIRTLASLAVLLLLTGSATNLAAEPLEEKPSSAEIVEQDRERIRDHLREVERQLRARDVSHLPADLQRARDRNIERLQTYRKRGVFPHNTIVPERRPIFIDEEGRHCAVGYLMKKSGWADQARSIAERENLAYLPNMKSPEVEQWVRQSGLTATEATLIQPTYCHLDTGYGSGRCGDYDTGTDTGPSPDGQSTEDDDSGGSETDATSENDDRDDDHTDASWSDASDDDQSDNQTDSACSITSSPQPPLGLLLLALATLPAILPRPR